MALTRKTIYDLTGGQKAHVNNMITNYRKPISEVKDYARLNWSIDLDLDQDAFDRYIRGESPSEPLPASNLNETVISEALSRDLGVVEPNLKLRSHQFQLANGERIDVLAEDAQGDNVVVEVKKYASSDALNQILGYMAQLRKAEPTKKVKGIIMSNSYDQDFADKVKLLAGSNIELRYFRLKLLQQTEDEARAS